MKKICLFELPSVMQTSKKTFQRTQILFLLFFNWKNVVMAQYKYSKHGVKLLTINANAKKWLGQTQERKKRISESVKPDQT